MTAPEVKRCARGDRCTGAEDTDQGRVGAVATRDLCDRCEDAAVDALDAAPGLYVDLRNAAIDRQSAGAAGEFVRKSRPGSFGLNGHPLFLSEAVHWTVCAWADEVISTAGRPSPDRVGQSEGQQLDDACVLLRTYLPVWLAHRPVELQVTRGNADPDDPKADPSEETVTVTQAGWEACSWLIDWQRTAERALKRPRLVHRPPEPCPACNVPRVLKRRDGDDKVECTNCGKSWTLPMYETFVHAWMGGETVPASDAGRRRGPASAAEGQDARRGTAAHTVEDVA